MKRIISLLLVLCLAAALFAGCEQVTAAVEIAEALDKTQALDSIDAEIVTKVTVSAEGESESMPVTVTMQAEGLQTDSPKVAMQTQTTFLNETITTHMYIEGEWMYCAMGDFKYKISASEAGEEEDYSETTNELMQDIPEELLKNVKLEKQADGSRSVTISIDDEQFAEIYEDIIESTSEDIGGSIDDMLISNAKVTITIKDGYVTKYALKYNMSMNIFGTKVDAEAEVSVTLKNPGSKVTVTPPEGYQDFPDLGDLGSLG